MENNKQPKPQEVSILQKSLKRAIGGGITGACAMVIQVTSLMWLRTTMNYQYRYGTRMGEAFRFLYQEGGVRRFYRGYGAALAIGPLSRFGDTAANTMAIEYLKDKTLPTSIKTMIGSSMAASYRILLMPIDAIKTSLQVEGAKGFSMLLKDKTLPTSIKTMIGSSMAASYRILLMPIDAIKTSLQVEGAKGFSMLRNKIKNHGLRVVYNGTVASMSATFVGHYPWFLVYNVLNKKIPKYDDVLYKKLTRNALIGFCSAVTSDTCSNSLRVIKTTKQTYHTQISYSEAVKMVIEKDGVKGLFGRGLSTRIATNGLQGMLFTVLWRAFEEMWFKKK
eukprot:CAMPEP_0170536314 /NCGR_PEP_ID=MMETSP0209-20121228/102082_1 /TAXON_ID=665100 ORGANISM="Litonotus pictus, Strain P1" /NCGR_SAMPLE_ID=MMETSP0209 /ASSEMBLY_ACC=CAM_ASM_000301 /LENGTH=334 /DNA_ID=CAMNT_0010837669 /DNA_START=1 /DNA_END=1005 /DNA_ORIENTATION=+